jgi:pre-mRNA-splicing factor CDC5/CEF1
MPTQWRSIAGCLEGRTPTQCLQHYEKLLDQAQGKDGLEDDPRRLRPGEIDPSPEVKPALPDPVDFDEDEKEMLQEARARLANTKGKKAKRKAREKTLDEAKRLAALQKRRELKAAGIHMPAPPVAGATKKKKRTKMIDVMAEIPFHKEAPAGFYDTSKEDAREAALTKNPRFKSMTLQRMEGERMQDVAERAKKKDNESMKKLKQDNLPVAMAKISKLNDTKTIEERPALNLPTPQITSAELDAIAKASVRGGGGVEEGGDEEGGVGGVTRSLMPRVDQTPSFTPMRTPLAAPGSSTVQREAQYLAAMARETQTPLVGGAGPGVSGAEFAAPSRPLVTPNVLKTPMLVARTGRAAATAATPLRAIADEEAVAKRRKTQGGEEGEESDQQLQQQQPDLFASLDALPAPKNEYRIVVPTLPQESAEGPGAAAAAVPVDASDVRNRHERQRTQQLRSLELLQSRVLLAGLPRAAEPRLAQGLSGPWGEQVAQLIAYDNAVTPMELVGGKKGKKAASKRGRELSSTELPPLEQFSEEELRRARQELEREAGPGWEAAAFAAEWDTHSATLVAVPGRGRIARAEAGSRAVAAALRAEYELVTAASQGVATQCQKLESKLQLLYQGYAARAEALGKAAVDAHQGLMRAATDAHCFRVMQVQETRSAHTRLARLEAEVAVVQSREEALQREYLELMRGT